LSLTARLSKSIPTDQKMGKAMAANSEAQQDMPAHAETYTGFLSLLKWGAAASFIVAFFVIFLIAR
jgi:hypothetical protein